MPSFYYPNLAIDAKQIELGGDEFHHLTRVFRARIGDQILLNSGQGLLATAWVREIHKHYAGLEIAHIEVYDNRGGDFGIAMSLLKNRHDELAVEKITELGAKLILPISTDNSVRQVKGQGIVRFQRISLAAIKQCDNPYLPIITEVHSLRQALEKISQMGYLPIVCSEEKPHLWMSEVIRESLKPCFVIGPEGGWSEDEQKLFQALDLKQISICTHILRAETAAIVVAAQWALLSRAKP